MKRKILLLSFLLVALAFISLLGPEQTVRADACSNCYTAFQSCYSGCAGEYDWCRSDGNPDELCQYEYYECTGNCTEVFNYCQNANCGGGSGGPGAQNGVGYGDICVSNWCGERAQCLDGSNYTDPFQSCQGLAGNDLEVCCNNQYNYYVFDLQVCFCTPNPRTVGCIGYPHC